MDTQLLEYVEWVATLTAIALIAGVGSLPFVAMIWG
jgi:hypothetical protein